MYLSKDNINWSKIFIFLYVIVAIIVICIIWKPFSNSSLSKYDKLKMEDVDKIASEEYINKIIYSIYENDIEYLYNKLLYSYVSYNNFDINSFERNIKNKFDFNNISVSNVEKINYKDIVVYRARVGQDRIINIIEKYGNDWNYTLDIFYNFKITNFYNQHNNIKFTIDSAYQTYDYIELTCYIENMSSNMVDIHLEQEDSILLKLSTDEVVELSNAQIDRNLSQINGKAFSSRTLKFNIDLATQSNIEQIIFNNVEINGEEKQVIISLDI